MNYRAPWWLPGGNLQTIWPALPGCRVAGEHPRYRRERWVTPDGDFIDLDWLDDEAPTLGAAGNGLARPPSRCPALLVLFHGLEGSSAATMRRPSPISRDRAGWPSWCRTSAVAAANSTMRPALITRATTRRSAGCWRACAKRTPDRCWQWRVAGRQCTDALGRRGRRHGGRNGRATPPVCSPLDLAAGSVAIGRGFNRLVYTAMFLRA